MQEIPVPKTKKLTKKRPKTPPKKTKVPPVSRPTKKKKVTRTVPKPEVYNDTESTDDGIIHTHRPIPAPGRIGEQVNMVSPAPHYSEIRHQYACNIFSIFSRNSEMDFSHHYTVL